jgi:hypothetical protein
MGTPRTELGKTRFTVLISSGRYKIHTVGRLATCGAEHDALDKHLGHWLTTSQSELPHREIATALFEKSEA